MTDISLPSGWASCQVDEFGQLIRGISYVKEQASKSPSAAALPILRANNINGSLNFEDLVYVPRSLITDEQLIKKGDIVFAMSSGSLHLVGKSAPALKDFDGSCGAFCAVLRVDQNVSAKFAGLLFQSSKFRRKISEIAKGSNINNLKREHILDHQVALPPFDEQRRIVEKIEELFSELDQGIENLKQARAQLAVYRQALLKHAFEGHPVTTKVKHVCSIQSGNGFPVEFQGRNEGELGFYKVGDISRNWKIGRVILSQAEHYISKHEAGQLGAKTLPAGAVVFAKIGAAVGLNRRAILKTASLVDNNVMGLIPGESVTSRFIFHFMCQIDLGARTRGGNVPSLRKGDVEEIDIPLLTQDQQDRIVADLDAGLDGIQALESDVIFNLQKAEALRQSILKRAFAGELVPQDPTDEPAAALLARIRAERAAAAPKERRQRGPRSVTKAVL